MESISGMRFRESGAAVAGAEKVTEWARHYILMELAIANIFERTILTDRAVEEISEVGRETRDDVLSLVPESADGVSKDELRSVRSNISAFYEEVMKHVVSAVSAHWTERAD